MYGDTLVMRRRAAQLREQGEDIRTMAEQLVTRSDEVVWTGRAADAMRNRVRERAVDVLREVVVAGDARSVVVEAHRHLLGGVGVVLAVEQRHHVAPVLQRQHVAAGREAVEVRRR